MLDLEIRYGDRKPEVRQLSKSQAVSIGRHGSNDICIDEPQVAPIHCRGLWNKTKTYFEVASANRDGVDLNGTMVRNSGLKGGDVLRIGSVDLIVREPGASTRDPASPPPTLHEQRVFDAAPSPPIRQSSHTDKSGSVPLAPISEETPAAREGWNRRVLQSASSSERGTPPRPKDGGKAGSKPVDPPAKSADHSPPKGWQQALLDDVSDESMPESDVPMAIWQRSGQGAAE